MYEKRIKTVQDLIEILQSVDDPTTTPMVMSDDLKFEYDEENNIMILRDELQGNLKLSLPAPFDVFNLKHAYEASVGTVKINLFDVVDDDMTAVFADPAFIHETGPFNIILGRLTDVEGEWQQIISLVYADSVIGYGLSVNNEVSEQSLSIALEQTLQKDADGNFISRVLATYQNYFQAVSDLYARSYIPAVEEYDLLWVDMSRHVAGAKLTMTMSKTPLTEGEKERVYDTDFEADFGVCVIRSGDEPIIKYGSETLSREEIEAHVKEDQKHRHTLPDNITAAIQTSMYTFEDYICNNH